jgi:hypothetical protein
VNAKCTLALVALLMACSAPASDDLQMKHGNSTDAMTVDSVLPKDSLATLIDALMRVGATYRLSTNGGWEFTGDRHLFESIRDFRDEAVGQLVRCLDRTEPTTTTIGDRSVPLGVLCYQALGEVAYHEAVDDSGDVYADWPGYILPTASPDELTAAREAWEHVVATRSYVLYP